ncbi:hypothetical protein YPPY91_1079, partial [Yersinia pestis PY-91]
MNHKVTALAVFTRTKINGLPSGS